MAPHARRWQRYALVLGAGLLLLALGWFGQAEYRDWRKARATQNYLEQIAARLPPDGRDAQNFFDHLRIHINRHSAHNIDAEFHRYWGQPEMYARFLAALEGQGPPPHMECSSRSGLMRGLLGAGGYATRGVAIYRRVDGRTWQSHSFLEVQNPANGRWEIQDPDYDVYWVERVSGERVGIRELLSGALDSYEPCHDEGCGWHIASREGIAVADLRSYFVLAAINDPARDTRVLYASRARFDQPDMLEAYCAYRAKDCRQQVETF